MDHFAGLDVSVKETSVCIVDDAGGIVREVKVASEPRRVAWQRSKVRPITSSGSGFFKPGRYRNGYLVLWRMRGCR